MPSPYELATLAPEGEAEFSLEGWTELFLMCGGAAAALVGLLFIAVSLNHEQILKLVTLPELAGSSITPLISVVIISIVGLVPDQPRALVGIELTLIGLVTCVVVISMVIRRLHQLERVGWRVNRVLLTVVSTIPIPIAGVLLILGSDWGLALIALQFVAAFITATYNA